MNSSRGHWRLRFPLKIQDSMSRRLGSRRILCRPEREEEDVKGVKRGYCSVRGPEDETIKRRQAKRLRRRRGFGDLYPHVFPKLEPGEEIDVSECRDTWVDSRLLRVQIQRSRLERDLRFEQMGHQIKVEKNLRIECGV